LIIIFSCGVFIESIEMPVSVTEVTLEVFVMGFSDSHILSASRDRTGGVVRNTDFTRCSITFNISRLITFLTVYTLGHVNVSTILFIYSTVANGVSSSFTSYDT